jgi:hypothetical protein
MSYFIFSKNLDNNEGTLYRIAENQYDFNNLNIISSEYKIIEDTEFNFNSIKYRTKYIEKYNENNIVYVDLKIIFSKKEELSKYINDYKDHISPFLKNNPDHLLYNKWNDFYYQLSNLNLDNISYPLNMSLEQYFKEQNQISLNPLQLP